jgi:HAE1 family hydrophobic/amphiphilic exporter-1
MNLPAFAVRRRVTVAMFFLAVAVLGVVSFTRLSLDMFPDVEPPVVSVITVWPGASATDVEQKVTERLENRLASTPELDEMTSISQDNVSVVQIKFDWGTNLDEATNNVRTLANYARREMPDEVEEPMLFRLSFSNLPIMLLGVTAKRGEIQEYSELIEDLIADDLTRVDGVASVALFNQRFKQLQVDVDRERLAAHELSLQQVAAAIRANNLTLPAGNVDMGWSTFTIRAPGEFETPEDLENVAVSQSPTTGALVHVKDIADVHFGLEEAVNRATLNNKNSVMLMIQREAESNTVDVARDVTERIAELNEELPEGLELHVVMDLSQNVLTMVDSLSTALYWGGAIVILVVIAFLRRLGSSLVVAASIPLSLVGVFGMLAIGGYTLNIVTIASMAIAAGMVVDNSIVVLDNIVRHQELGAEVEVAAPEGAAEVGNAITAASLTTISIFVPVLFIGGIVGIMFNDMSFVVIVAIVTSLLVSLMLVPVLATRLLRKKPSELRKGRLKAWSEGVFRRVERGYGALVGLALRHRKKVVLIAILGFVGSFVLTTIIGVDFMPQTDGGQIEVQVELPIGTKVDRTFAVADRIRRIIEKRVPEAEAISLRAGASRSGMDAVLGGRQGSNIATIGCRVPRRKERERSTFAMADAIRPEIEAIPGLVSVEVSGQNPLARLASGGTGKPLTVEVFTEEIGDLRTATRKIKKIVQKTPGAVDVVTDLMDDNPEIRLSIDRDRSSRLGVPIASIAASVRMAMYGQPITRYRGGKDDIDVFLRLDEADRDEIADLANLTVPALTGKQIELSTVASLEEGRSPLEIRRTDQQRMLRVMAGISGRPLGDVAGDVERAIERAKKQGEIDDDVAFRFSGDVREQRTMLVDLTLALLLSIMLVYMVMAGQFESLVDPLVVMFSVPFGITGVLLALPAAGVTLSITSFIGTIMLVGIVVNNAIVLVDYANQLRDRGMGLEEALRLAGERRLRPVLMTALTTVGGMLPLAISSGEGSEIWRPFAVAVIGGLLFSTLITLVLIPTTYALTDRWRSRGTRKGRR